MSAKACLVIGDINIDFAIHSKTYPPEGGEAHAEQADFRLGGSGCLSAIALQRLGCPTMLAGNVGNDVFADFAMQHIRAAGLDSALIQRLAGQQTGFFMILVTPGGQRTMFGNRGANAVPMPEEMLIPTLPACRHLHLSGYSLLGEDQYEMVRAFVPQARQAGLSISLDPGVCTSSQARQKLLDLLPLVDFFLPSMDELRILTGKEQPDAQIAAILALGCKSLALKMGALGSRFVDGSLDIHQPAIHDDTRPVLDTTGAGDCFNAGFLHGMLSGAAVEEALLAGNQAAFRMITSPHGILDLIAS